MFSLQTVGYKVRVNVAQILVASCKSFIQPYGIYIHIQYIHSHTCVFTYSGI